MVGAAGLAQAQMQGNLWKPETRVRSVDLGLDVALEQGTRRLAARVAVIEAKRRLDRDAGRQAAPSRTGASAPASPMLRLRSMPCETTVCPGSGSRRSPSSVTSTRSGSNETISPMAAMSSNGERYDHVALRASPTS